eukprot:gene9507-1602_t
MLQLGAAALSGFTAPLAPAHAPAAALSMVERSAALPFLKKPPALDGSMVGDEGFDPLGFSTTITELGGDLCYVREAELMHGRQAMLACVGFVWPAAVGALPDARQPSSLPNLPWGSSRSSITASPQPCFPSCPPSRSPPRPSNRTHDLHPTGKLPVDWAAGVSTDPLIAQHQLPSE